VSPEAALQGDLQKPGAQASTSGLRSARRCRSENRAPEAPEAPRRCRTNPMGAADLLENRWRPCRDGPWGAARCDRKAEQSASRRHWGKAREGTSGDAGLRRDAAVTCSGGEELEGPGRVHVRRTRPGRELSGSASRSFSPRIPQSSGCRNLGGNETRALRQRGAASGRTDLRAVEPQEWQRPRGRKACREQTAREV